MSSKMLYLTDIQVIQLFLLLLLLLLLLVVVVVVVVVVVGWLVSGW
jgi:hypothetical protein